MRSRIVRHYLTNTSLRKKLIFAFIFIIFIPFAISNILLLKQLSDSFAQYKNSNMINNLEQISYNVENSLNLYNQQSDLIFYNREINSIIYNNYNSENPLYQIYEAYSTINSLFSTLLNTNNDLLKIKIFSGNASLTADQDIIFRIDEQIRRQEWFDAAVRNHWKKYYSNLNPVDPSNRASGAAGKGKNHFYFSRALTFWEDTASPAVLVIDISEQHFFSLIEKEPLSNKLYIVNDQGYVVSSNDRTSLGKPFQSLYAFEVASLTKGMRNIEWHNRSYTLTFTTNAHNWKIVSAAEANALFNIPDRLLILVLFVYLACLIVSILLAALFSDILTKRLALFEKYVNNMEADSFNMKFLISGNDEIGKIFTAFNFLLQRVKNYVLELKENETLIRNSEIKALQSQINPHFLYNTMEAIYWLIQRKQEDKAAQMVIELSQFYKAVLNKGDSLVEIRDEIKLVNHYLSIESKKLDALVKVEYEIEEGCLDNKILKFLLQPFFENILNHAIYPNMEIVQIEIRIFKSDSVIHIEISDNGIGMDADKLREVLNPTVSSEGYAIYNIKQRLKLYYQDGYSLTIASKPYEGTTVTIVIPERK